MLRLWRTLRSRRVALWLIGLLCVYSAAVTLVPQQAMSPEQHARWIADASPVVTLARALGADRAYTSPLFLAMAAALALSTAVCAWERSVRAVRVWRDRGRVSDRVRARLESKPDIEVASSLPASVLADVAAGALTRLGLRVRRGPVLSYAERDAWGLVGSPLFHWSMVALVLVVALGQLTRWEGLMGVPQTGPVVEAQTTYRQLDEGPLALPHTGWELSLAAVQERMRLRGVEYGFTPTIAVSDGRRVLARQAVYPNNPLRYGPLLIHLSDHGLAVHVEVVGPDGGSWGVTDQLVDFSDETSSGTLPSAFLVNDMSGQKLADASVWVEARDRRGVLPRLKPPGEVIVVNVVRRDGSAETTRLAQGESTELGAGYRLFVRDFGYYARLSVVRDWSVGWLYALLGIMTIGVTVALMQPFRCVWFMVREEGDGCVLRANVMHYRRDPLFNESIEAALVQVATDEGGIRGGPATEAHDRKEEG